MHKNKKEIKRLQQLIERRYRKNLRLIEVLKNNTKLRRANHDNIKRIK